MKMFSIGLLTAGHLCLITSAFICHAQAPSLEPAQGLKARSPEERAIVIDAVALDSQRKPLRSTQAKDVSIRVDGRSIPASDIHVPASTNESPQIVLILDAINATPTDLTRSAEAIQTYLHLNGGRLAYPTSIFVLTDTSPQMRTGGVPSGEVKVLSKRELYVYRIPPSMDGLELSRGLDFYEPGLQRVLSSQAGAGQSERVSLSLRALDSVANAEQSVAGPKLVIWISQGWPYLAAANVKAPDQLFSSVVYFSDLLRSTRMMLFAIDPRGLTSQDNSAIDEGFMLNSRHMGFGSGAPMATPTPITDDYYKNFLNPVRSARDADPNDLSLQVLAIGSGGRVIQHRNDLTDQLVQCVAEADSLLSFTFNAASHGVGMSFHAVSATLASGNGTVRTRPGFYAR